MRAIIVASSPYQLFDKLYTPLEGDLIVGVDGGCKAITKYNIDIAFGDFDSLNTLVKANKIYRYSPQKDETDLELAVEALKEEVDEFLIFNATGGRLDHFLANLKLLERYPDLNIAIIDEHNQITCINEGVYNIKKGKYKYFSLIPCIDSNVSITNALYEITKKDVSVTDTYTVSNQVKNDEAQITVHQGRLYLIESIDA
ncbi:MAG: thiamine diphosphokinase [Bacilli bacterium]|nr:thiamine diphosphokinase [Bacilli bacterium]